MVHPHVCHVGGGRMWEASVRHHTAFSKWLPECLHSLSVIPQLIPEQVFQENDFFFISSRPFWISLYVFLYLIVGS